MTRALVLGCLLMCGCKRQLGGVEVAVQVTGPAGACLEVSTRRDSDTFPELAESALKRVAIKETAASGPTFEVISQLHEQACDGGVIASDRRMVTATVPPAVVMVAVTAADGDHDGYSPADGGADCDDADAGRRPGAMELCNGVDDDCDGVADEGLTMMQYYVDGDRDGYGRPDGGVTGCSATTGLSLAGTDCDDTDAGVSPGAPELCNGGDENCNGTADEGLMVDAGCDPGMLCTGRNVCAADGTVACERVETPLQWYEDRDVDGVGAQAAELACMQPRASVVSTGGDCDDDDPFNTPGRAEICDQGRDNDCSAATVDACDGGWRRFTGYFTLISRVISVDAGVARAVGDSSELYFAQARQPLSSIHAACNGMPNAGDQALRAIWHHDTTGSTYIASNEVYRFDPDGGCPRVFPTTRRAYSMEGRSTADGGTLIFTSGNSQFARFTDPPSSLNAEFPLMPGLASDALSVISAAELVFAGSLNSRPAIVHWVDGGFVPGFVDDAGTAFATIHLRSSGHGWAAGDTGALVRFDGSSWRRLPLPDAGVGIVYGTWSFGDSSVYLVDSTASVFRASVDDAGTVRVELLFRDAAAGYLGSIHGTAPDDIWVTGPGGRFYHFSE